MTILPIHKVDRRSAQAVEPLGSKPKFWFREADRRLLFKADDRGTGEDWAEVIACHLCGLLGLPHVKYELAAEYDGEQYIRPGVMCENMAPPPITLVLGNELLLALDPKYPKEGRFRVRQHAIEAVVEVVSKLATPSDDWMRGIPTGIRGALDIFVGYVMLDAWIGNPDRHHENWGALRDGGILRLAPTFDHGAGLARNLRDEEREERFTTRDRNRTVAAFARRGRSALFESAEDLRPLGLHKAFSAICDRAPHGRAVWLGQLAAVKEDAVWSILEMIPEERMSETSKRFTLALLSTNQRLLLE